MPGKLKDDAVCPICGEDIIGVYRNLCQGTVRLQFVHRGNMIENHQVEGPSETMAILHRRLHVQPGT